MHDLILAQDILKKVLKVARKNKLKKVSKIFIKLGKIKDHDEIISPDNLRFNLNLLAKDSIAQKAKIFIKKTKDSKVKLESIEGN